METNDVVKELGTKITIPKGIKLVIFDKMFKNLCMAVLVLLYFILIILTIVSFELGYRRNSIEMGMHGAELLFLSIITLFMPYIYFHRGLILRFIYSFSAIYVMVYYFIKCVYIYMNETRKYKNGLSDIKEIVDEDEEESYLDKPSERKFKDVEEEETRAAKSTLERMLEKPKKTVKSVAAKATNTKKTKTTKKKKEDKEG